jgi:hypothetical protein
VSVFSSFEEISSLADDILDNPDFGAFRLPSLARKITYPLFVLEKHQKSVCRAKCICPKNQ